MQCPLRLGRSKRASKKLEKIGLAGDVCVHSFFYSLMNASKCQKPFQHNQGYCVPVILIIFAGDEAFFAYSVFAYRQKSLFMPGCVQGAII